MKNHLNTLFISCAVVLAGYLLATGYKNRAKTGDSISVTGLGEENFVSDLIVWRGDFSKKDMDLKVANAELNKDQELVKRYLLSKGLSNEEIIFEGVNIQRDYYYDYDENGQLKNTVFNGYILTQSVMVKSNNVNLVEGISRKVADLINQDVEFNSSSPQFYYTKLAALKIKMIESATKDAKNRAETIARNAGDELGKLKNADLGVFQITAEHSAEDYSWGGSFNTSSKNKKASITVRLKYSLN